MALFAAAPSPLFAQDTGSPPRLMRGDVSGTVGWLSTNKGDLTYDFYTDWQSQAAFSIGDLVFVYLRPHLGLWLTLASIAIGVVAALLLVPPLGISGAALSVLAAYAVRAAMRSIVLRLQFHLDVPRGHHAGPLAAAALGVAAVFAARLSPLHLPFRLDPLPLVAGLGLYAAGLAAWLALRKQSLSLRGFTAD